MAYYAVRVVPEVEASFPGGKDALNNYLYENVVEKLTEKGTYSEVLPNGVQFVVDENGRIDDVEVIWMAEKPNWNDQIVEAFYAMPRWVPAQDVNGENVRQQFTIPFLNIGC